MIRQLLKAFADLIFPPLCLHCRASLPVENKIFCSLCFDLMPLIDCTERCPSCFSGAFDPLTHFCAECARHPPLFDRIGAAFDYVGPAATLVKKMKYGNQPYLSKGGGAFLAAQWMRLEWPLPDFIVPVPLSWIHWAERGYNQSLLLSTSLGEILKIPVADILIRKSGDYSQAGLNRQQRIEYIGNTFQLKRGVDLRDKTILLVDDVMTTGSTLRKCAEALLEGGPAKLYSLVLCRAF